MCPLDVIKTRLQVHGLTEFAHSARKGGIIVTIFQNIIRAEGVKGLYRGLSPTLAALLPNWADQEIDEDFELLVLASDGLWDVVPNEKNRYAIIRQCNIKSKTLGIQDKRDMKKEERS